ncbi:hypothetical protein ACJJTC_009308 [Scirpophaga incertulas]
MRYLQFAETVKAGSNRGKPKRRLINSDSNDDSGTTIKKIRQGRQMSIAESFGIAATDSDRNNIQKAGVQYIIDSVVKELWEDPARRFIYVESAFLSKWWYEQTKETQAKVRTLVEEGRLKFIGGAWSMNDEAATYYQSTIDQFTLGLSFLNRTFGECGRPRIGWQIDPFGHSRELASLLAGMGYDGLFLGRIDYRDKLARMEGRTMEFIWRGDDSLGKQSDIFTGILYNRYSPPPGFCFDILCSDEPIVDDPSSPDYNVDRRVSDFIEYAKKARTNYRTDNVLITMGGDFTYQDAGMWYKNLDKLIKYGNKKAEEEKLNVTLFYSTPDCYLKAVKDANPKLPIKQDDFFPYASDPHAYWTGYFTSRPNSKFLEAEANRYLQMVKQMSVLTDLPKNYESAMEELKAALGILQHHDAVTGTEKQHVTDDYVRLTDLALRRAHGAVTNVALNKMINPNFANVQLHFDRCQFNESSCVTSEEATGDLMVTVYNPLAWAVTAPVSVPTGGAAYDVRDTDGTWHHAQISPIPPSVLRLPSRKSSATHEATFVAKLPPLGYKTFYMRRTPATLRRRSLRTENEMYNRQFDPIIEQAERKGIFDPIIERADVNTMERVKRYLREKRYAHERIDSVAGNTDAVVIENQVVGDLVREPISLYGSMAGNDPMIVEMYSNDQRPDVKLPQPRKLVTRDTKPPVARDVKLPQPRKLVTRDTKPPVARDVKLPQPRKLVTRDTKPPRPDVKLPQPRKLVTRDTKPPVARDVKLPQPRKLVTRDTKPPVARDVKLPQPRKLVTRDTKPPRPDVKLPQPRKLVTRDTKPPVARDVKLPQPRKLVTRDTKPPVARDVKLPQPRKLRPDVKLPQPRKLVTRDTKPLVARDVKLPQPRKLVTRDTKPPVARDVKLPQPRKLVTRDTKPPVARDVKLPQPRKLVTRDTKPPAARLARDVKLPQPRKLVTRDTKPPVSRDVKLPQPRKLVTRDTKPPVARDVKLPQPRKLVTGDTKPPAARC